MKRLPVILTCIIAAAVVFITAVLVVRMNDSAGVIEQTDKINSAESNSANSIPDESISDDSYTSEPSSTEELSTEKGGFWSSVFGDDDESKTEIVTTTGTTDAISSVVSEVVSAVTSVSQKMTTSAKVQETRNTAAFNKVFKMPQSPKYIPPNYKVDFDTASIASYKYDPEGNYYYTDDKNAWQKGFGYNQIYDKLSGVVAMYYDTVRNTFSYDGKDWLIQFWKGQYGYYYVGSEIGIYTKTQGKSGTYACADKSDWVHMEMCFMWDENDTGDYEPIFTRPYDEYWWCTGFVIGFESAECMKSREQFRVVGHITFNNTEMANLFCSAMTGNGFKRVNSLLDTEQKDSFVQVGVDVGFVWQSINKK